MRIIWVGGFALISSIGVALLLDTAQAAERVVQVRQRAEDLTAGQRSALATIITSMFPTATAGQVDGFGCGRIAGGVRCRVAESKSGDADAYFADVDGGAEVQLDSWDGATANWKSVQTELNPSAAQLNALGTFASVLWPGTSVVNVRNLRCRKDTDEQSPTVDCTMDEVQTKTPTETLDTLRDNPGSKVVGVVE